MKNYYSYLGWWLSGTTCRSTIARCKLSTGGRFDTFCKDAEDLRQGTLRQSYRCTVSTKTIIYIWSNPSQSFNLHNSLWTVTRNLFHSKIWVSLCWHIEIFVWKPWKKAAGWITVHSSVIALWFWIIPSTIDKQQAVLSAFARMKRWCALNCGTKLLDNAICSSGQLWEALAPFDYKKMMFLYYKSKYHRHLTKISLFHQRC